MALGWHQIDFLLLVNKWNLFKLRTHCNIGQNYLKINGQISLLFNGVKPFDRHKNNVFAFKNCEFA